MKTYDLVKKLLTEYPELRNSDKKLIWKVWEVQGVAKTYITKQDFMEKAELSETIRRARQLVMEEHPELKGHVRNSKKEATKGTFAFRTLTPVFNNDTNTVSFI